ncbi:MAG: lamin tail domain-containing protein [Prolixibacteraceae bacterium]|nr:lamin tail domain-containing protein [Prolixibacteraceae bacterium]MBN2649617.1 lamin tail domain-containing protein [Prolixibacteraceae bacterium]
MNKTLLLIIGLMATLLLKAQSDLIISEYVEGWSNNKAIEIYNPTSEAINLADYQLVRYANGEDIPPAENDWKIVLPDVSLESYKAYVCVLDKRDPNGTDQEAPVWDQLQERADVFLCPNYNISNTLYHNGDDAVALEKLDGSLVDLFGRWGAPRPADAALPGSDRGARCWTDTSPYFTGAGIGITADHTLYRKASIVEGVKENPSMFNPLEQWDSLSANTFTNLGWHKSDAAPENATPVFTADEFTFKIWKQAANETVLGTVAANDAENDDLRFYINSGNFIYDSEDVRRTPFEMNRETGEIVLVDAASLIESEWDTLFIDVTVTDGFSESEAVKVMAVLTNDEQSGFEEYSMNDLRIFPNPISGGLLSISATKSIRKVSIVNILGQESFASFVDNKNLVQVDASSLKKGVYLIRIEYSDRSTDNKRIIRN